MKKLLKFAASFEDCTAPVFLALMCLAVTAQIVGRVIVKKPLLYTEEIARFSYIWCVYILIAMGEKHQDHFSVDVFVKFLRGRADLALRVVEKALGCLIFGYLFYWSLKFYHFEKIIESPAFGISMGLVSASLCVGFFLAFVRRGAHLVRAVKDLMDSGGSRRGGPAGGGVA